MDFTDRSMRPNQQTNSDSNLGSAPSQGSGSGKKSNRFHKLKNHKLLNITYITLLFSATILIVGVVLLIFFYDGRDKEVDYVDTDKYQAVFLNGGQVYFGKIVELNRQYMSLTDIYYLTPNRAVQSDNGASANNFTIRKLGCELHRPQDVMVINHDQIVFWENLKKDDSQNTVPGAIKQLADQPQDCNAQQTQSTTESNDSANSSETTDDSSDSSSTDDSSTDSTSTDSTTNNQ